MIRNVRSAVVFGATLALMSVLASAQALTTRSVQSTQAGTETAAPAQQEQAPPAMIPAEQQATKEQLAKLFEVMRLREQMQSMMKMMPTMVQQQIKEQSKEIFSKMPAGASLTPEQEAGLEQIVSKHMEKAMNIYPVDEMISDMTEIYQRHLSRTDVDGFIAFYSSAAGQHLLNEQPAIMKEYMPQVMKRVNERTKQLTADLMKDIQEFAKSATPPEKAPAPK